MVVVEAIKEAISLQGLIEKLRVAQEHLNIYCNSQSAIYLTKNQVYLARIKHIDVCFDFMTDQDQEQVLPTKTKCDQLGPSMNNQGISRQDMVNQRYDRTDWWQAKQA